MNYEGIKTEYLCYLMNRVGLEAEGKDGFLRLCETLQEIEFRPYTDMDENRCGECRILREDFAVAEGDESIGDILDAALCESGTMMEVLTILAEKMAYEMLESQFEASARKWFIEMLDNCGIGEYVANECFEYEGNEEIIQVAMENVIFHRTDSNGNGGLFPLMYPKYDQRLVELVIQMNNYLEERYDIL